MKRWYLRLVLLAAVFLGLAAIAVPGAKHAKQKSTSQFLGSAEDNAKQLIDQGQQVFRFDTFVTGAYADRKGLFEKAHGGTMFLDEIGDMSLEIQAKLLRTLQTGEIRAVGDVRTKAVSVRIIAATNQNLEEGIHEGKFREDLFYRINTFTITLPPLRERIEDIPLLAEYFLQRARAKVNKRVESVSPEAVALLRSYAWPGNLRKLENIIEPC